MSRMLIFILILSTIGLANCVSDLGAFEEASHKTSGVSANSDSLIWFDEVGGSGEEAHAHFILATSDGGFIQVGETGFVPRNARILVVKIGADGQLLWKREIGQTGHNLGNALIEVSEGYWVVGALNHDSALIKLDKHSGTILAEFTYDFGGSDGFEHMVENNDGIIAVGYNYAEDREGTFHVEGKGLIAQIDDRSNLIQFIDLGNRLAQAYRISAYEGDYFVAGQTPGASDYGIMRLNSNLEERWFKAIGGRADDHNFAFAQHSDGSLYLSGHTTSDVQNWDIYTVKLDADGNLLWQRTQGNPRGFDPRYIHDEAWDIKVDKRGWAYVIAGTGDEYAYSACSAAGCSDVWRAYLLTYDAQGDLRSERVFGQDELGDWAGEAIALTHDNALMIAIDNGQFGFLKVSR